jgi:hypothetical protein
MPGMDKNELIHKIGESLVHDIGPRRKNWAHLVLVGTVEKDTSGMKGFAYDKSGDHEAVSPRGSEALDLLEQLRDAMSKSDRKPPWRTALIRVARDTGEITFDFEYDDADRWAFDFKNADKRAKELSPSKD